MKYWEIIADNLSNAGWSLGYVSAVDSNGRTIWIADAHLGRCLYLSPDKPLHFFVDRVFEFSSSSASLNGSESGGGHSPARFFASSRPAIVEHQFSGEKKAEPHESTKKSNCSISNRPGAFTCRSRARPPDVNEQDSQPVRQIGYERSPGEASARISASTH